MNFVDLPTLADEFAELDAVAVPLTAERMAAARAHVAAVAAQLLAADASFARADALLQQAEPGTDFDFIVRDLLIAQRGLMAAQVQVTSSMQLLMRANISLTAACTLAQYDDAETEVALT